MSGTAQKPLLIHPLLSAKATGMGVAAVGLTQLLVPDLAERSPRIERVVYWINDRVSQGVLRMFLRLSLMQIAPLLFRGRHLVFTSHHAPLWRTGRHTVIVYDLIALRHASQARVQHFFYRYLLPRVLRRASRVVTISASVRDDLAVNFPGSVTGKVEVIPAYSSRLLFATNGGSPLVDRLSAATFAFVGARYAHKNLDLVLRVLERWESYESGMPCPKLVVAGCRRELWDGLAALEARGVAKVFEFASETQLDLLLRTCTALLYLSRDEGQGLPPLEAMAMGCPLVCSDIAVLRDTCGDAAVYANPEDAAALLRVLVSMLNGSMNDELEHMRAIGLARVDHFRSDALRERWKEFLHATS